MTQSLMLPIYCVACNKPFYGDVERLVRPGTPRIHPIIREDTGLKATPMRCSGCGFEIWPWTESLDAFLKAHAGDAEGPRPGS